MPGDENKKATLLALPYPNPDQWKNLVEQFTADAIAHKLLLSHIPFVFQNEPAKFAMFRRIIADAFNVSPTDVFIVGSAMAGRSLKGDDIDKQYSTDSDIDTLIISEHLFTTLLTESLDWIREATTSKKENGKWVQPQLSDEVVSSLHRLSDNACKGIWRPDSLPKQTPVRERFFKRFERVSLHTLGLQLSEDTVASVSGRVARSFENAVSDLAGSIYRLKKEFRAIAKQEKDAAEKNAIAANGKRPMASAKK